MSAGRRRRRRGRAENGDDAGDLGRATTTEGEEPPPATRRGAEGWSGRRDDPTSRPATSWTTTRASTRCRGPTPRTLEDDVEEAGDDDAEPEDDAEPDEEAPAGEDGLTREADTLALADQEEAREAALAGHGAPARPSTPPSAVSPIPAPATVGRAARAADAERRGGRAGGPASPRPSSRDEAAGRRAPRSSRRPPAGRRSSRPRRSCRSRSRSRLVDCALGALPDGVVFDHRLDGDGHLDQPARLPDRHRPGPRRAAGRVADQLEEVDGGEPAELPHPRLRRAPGRGRPRPLRHDDPAARRP